MLTVQYTNMHIDWHGDKQETIVDTCMHVIVYTRADIFGRKRGHTRLFPGKMWTHLQN